jgi:TolB-like protein/DNA-binding winged helix-turn-helix (wHTH) protein/Tfp pilus assembly protein PilF
VTSEPGKSEGAVRIGDDFDFEPRIPRLRRAGCVLKLQRVPLEALAALIEQKGRIVSRDQLAERIWGKGVSLDADNSLNVAIRKLRHALGDNPEEPHFIQTITGQGYRLIAPVVASVVDAGLEPNLEQPPVAAEAKPLALEPPAGEPKPRRWPVWAAGAVIVSMIAAGCLYWARVHKGLRQPATGRLMLAVLPFENLTGDVAQDYFSDGLTEEMITQAGNLDPQQLGVIGRTSVMYYKHRQQPLLQLGHDLGVQYVLEGSVRRDHEHARISVRLLRVADGATLWMDSFDRSIGDVLTLQSEIAQRIGGKLLIQVLGRAKSTPTRPEVVEAYLRGRFELNRLDTREAAQGYFERTIALDPSYAPAYAGLADFYCFRAVTDDEGSEQAWRLAEQNATKAMSLDGNSEEAHIAIARIKLMHDWDWRAAREHALRALQLNPSSPEAHTVFAQYLRIAGNLPQDLIHRRQALAMDPYREDLKEHLVSEQYFARDYQSLVASARHTLSSDPNNLEAHVGLCNGLGRLSFFAESAAECSKALVLEGQPDWAAAYAQEYRQRGYNAANLFLARKQLNAILALPHPDLWELANAYVAAGMKEKTFQTLFQGVPTHEPGLLQIRVDPDFDSIRNDSRYLELVRAIGFPNEKSNAGAESP